MFYAVPLGPQRGDLVEGAEGPPWVTLGLVSALLAGYVALVLPADPATLHGLLGRYGVRPDAARTLAVFSHPFLHVSPLGLVWQVAAAACFGTTVERRFGHLATGLIAGLAAAAAGFGSAWTARPFEVPGIAGEVLAPYFGAAGVTAGLAAALAPEWPGLKIRFAVAWRGRHRVVALPAWVLALGFFAPLVAAAGTRLPERGTLGALAGGAAAGVICGGVFVFMDRRVGEERLAGVVRAGRLSSRFRAVARPEPAAAPVVPDAPAPPAPLPGGDGEESVSFSRDLPEVSLDLSATFSEGAPELDLSESLGPEVPAPPPLPGPATVPPRPSAPTETGGWADSARRADIEDRIRRARRMEKDPAEAEAAFDFYRELLQAEGVEDEFRLFAGARAARMMLRRGRYRRAEKLARWLLQHELNPELCSHIEGTMAASQDGLKRRRARARGGGG